MDVGNAHARPFTIAPNGHATGSGNCAPGPGLYKPPVWPEATAPKSSPRSATLEAEPARTAYSAATAGLTPRSWVMAAFCCPVTNSGVGKNAEQEVHCCNPKLSAPMSVKPVSCRRVGLLHRSFGAGRGVYVKGEGIAGLEGGIAKKTEDVAVEVVRAALGD